MPKQRKNTKKPRRKPLTQAEKVAYTALLIELVSALAALIQALS